MAARSKITVGVLIAAAAALLAASSGVASVRPAGEHVIIVGGTGGQRELARIAALRVGGTTLSRVVFRKPSRVLRNEHVKGAELVVVAHGKGTLRSEWEQGLYIGSYLGLMTRWRGGTVAAAAGGYTEGPVSWLRPFEVFASNPRAIKVDQGQRRLVESASIAKATVVELRTAVLPARAIALTVRVNDPAAFLKHRAIRLLDLLGHPTIPLLGYYFAAEDSDGGLVWATSRLPGTGGVYTTPSLGGCNPVHHSYPAPYQRPPCPAP